jgi:exodeoxyribonuclease V alpha subunit
MYRGPVGVANLNEKLQAALNPPGSRKAEHRAGGAIYRVGDKVLQTRNNYDKDVFNGDIGRVAAIDQIAHEMTVRFDEDRPLVYDWSELGDLIHAFAISVHRAQGSEYPCVVVPIMMQHYLLLQRNLLYTAITRARSLVVLVGERRAIALAVKNDKIARRYTLLAARLRGEL